MHFTFFFYNHMEKRRNSQAPVLLTTADAADPSPVLVWLAAPSPLHPAFWPEPHGTEPDSADQNIACNHSPISPDITHRSTNTLLGLLSNPEPDLWLNKEWKTDLASEAARARSNLILSPALLR